MLVERPLPHPAPGQVPRSPVAWQKRWKVPRACTCWAWSLRKGGSKVTRGRPSGPEPGASQGLRGEEDESGTRQDREEDPGGGRGIRDEAARQRTEKREGTEAEVVRNTLHAEKGAGSGEERDPVPPWPLPGLCVEGTGDPPHHCTSGGRRPHGLSKARAHVRI